MIDTIPKALSLIRNLAGQVPGITRVRELTDRTLALHVDGLDDT